MKKLALVVLMTCVCFGQENPRIPQDCEPVNGKPTPAANMCYFKGQFWPVEVVDDSTLAKKPKPKPVDVPAIKSKKTRTIEGKESCSPMHSPIAGIPDATYCEHYLSEVPIYYCADKARIMLTSGDGKKWCHKPQTGREQ